MNAGKAGLGLELILDDLAALEAAETAEGAVERFEALLPKVGIPYFCCGLVDNPASADSKNGPLITNWPVGWEDYYRERRAFQYDPIVRGIASIDRPFYWSETAKFVDEQGASLLAEARGFSLDDGFVVPIRGRDYRIDTVIFAGPELDWSPENEKLAHLAALYLIGKLRQLLRDETSPKAALSPRERECLQWVAAGKTYDDVADVLGIGRETVRTHIKRAMAKLDATSVAQAVAAAIRAGQILP